MVMGLGFPPNALTKIDQNSLSAWVGGSLGAPKNAAGSYFWGGFKQK